MGNTDAGRNPTSVLLKKHDEGSLKTKWGNGCALHHLFSNYSDWSQHLYLQSVTSLVFGKKHIFPQSSEALLNISVLGFFWPSSAAAAKGVARIRGCKGEGGVARRTRGMAVAGWAGSVACSGSNAYWGPSPGMEVERCSHPVLKQGAGPTFEIFSSPTWRLYFAFSKLPGTCSFPSGCLYPNPDL